MVSWIDLLKTGELTNNGGASLYRAGMGLLLSIVIGAALGIFMAWWKPINVLLSAAGRDFLSAAEVGADPGHGDLARLRRRLEDPADLPRLHDPGDDRRLQRRALSEQTLVWSARSMGANRLRMLWDVVLPSAMPELLNGIRTALALSFILLVSARS